MADVKTEIKPEIKVDPATQGSNLADIEEFEDDIDLAFPDPNAQSWLLKVPEDLWKAWAEAYKEAPDDVQIEIGKMHVPKNPTVSIQEQALQIYLHPHVPQHQNIPKKFHVKVNTDGYNNTVVFSEKDLPGHRPLQAFRNRSYLQGSKPTGVPSRDQRYGNNNKFGRSRSAIPKQTALAPLVQHEATVTPMIDANYEADFAAKWQAHMAPKSRTTFIENVDRNLATGVPSKLSTFSTFGTTSRPGAKGKKAAAKGKDKAVRMDRGDLLDALQRCFRRYRYWSMKALRNELRQPEVWIKEVLEGIAFLVRSGDFAMNWTLKPEMQSIIQEEDEVKQETAPQVKAESGTEGEGGTGDEFGDDDGDDDLGGFEDVQMEGGV
ncbi:hypothetical protein BAUCODRAFT_36832 [Baudoinia panamericana UAMH 10762]|uniref:Transcription initiation factor IIF subunit beta n=1 Tax=Baudoinia panamericana (strain UAMH 10762) TaxID=717646 RepID=M2N387_BAUPA|nr:uncharacterized protein BAUCODRAFT_36832 [Baudoinia panamericana UAMH 10762]EMC93165.1 hypothetical protein BAUCODRAFT_36832 [Baudoinia panamericana UAMH 10762]